MPYLSELVIHNFRNIGSASVEPNTRLNFIVGPNGSGKSSLLESLSILAHGKSFRTHKYRNLIKDNAQDFVLFSRLFSDAEPMGIPIGIKRTRSGEFKIRMNERNVSSSASLAEKLPLIIINSNSFSLLEGSPKERRRYFDWLVFHVKHQFGELWKKVSRCIKQRNSLLRRDKITYEEIEPWDKEIAQLSEEIDQLRRECFSLLANTFESLDVDESFTDSEGQSITLPDVRLEYISGWKEDMPILEQLQAGFERDQRYGYTVQGPHKADIKIKHGRHLAVEVLSRGQQKLLICALFIAEAKVYKEISGLKPVFAIDDLPSELDNINQQILGRWLDEFNSQLFITGITDEFAHNVWPNKKEDEFKVFHVKHGTIES